eukprot:gb/GFBE01034654.1/.p1 GENE.gb/GFBE01034654.1/~~gb/GFBE01034654.1/.p1  ORF type:complete len:318 (+),score=54.88 gb/GFBE01034654.1/:1-954(+)
MRASLAVRCLGMVFVCAFVTESLATVCTEDATEELTLLQTEQATQRRRIVIKSSENSCGFKTDCALDYNISDVVATREKMPASEKDRRLQEAYAQAKATCVWLESGMAMHHGGWCYHKDKSILVDKGDFADRSYRLPENHVEFDRGLLKALATKVLRDGESVTDLGAGVGQLGHALKVVLPNIHYHGYDGAGNVAEFTENYVHFADLTVPLDVKRSDWVVSSEVGEHIRHEFEPQVIANLHEHNCKGIVLTWAVLGQGGFWHVNCHSNAYLINIFTQLGYKYDSEKADALRASATESGWLNYSTMVFVRTSAPSGCK